MGKYKTQMWDVWWAADILEEMRRISQREQVGEIDQYF